MPTYYSLKRTSNENNNVQNMSISCYKNPEGVTMTYLLSTFAKTVSVTYVPHLLATRSRSVTPATIQVTRLKVCEVRIKDFGEN